jgi:twitching motility protein PilT
VTLLDSLLDAIIRLDGEALVMHAGEKPYVVLSSASTSTFRGPLAWGQVELSSRPLTADAVLGMLAQMLSAEQSRSLDECGAIEHEIDAPGHSGDRFIVTAARGGDDVWVEVRRRPKVVAPPAPAPDEAPAHESADASASQPIAASEPERAPRAESQPAAPSQVQAAPEPEAVIELAAEPDVRETAAIQEDVGDAHEIEDDLSALVDAAAGIAAVFQIASPAIQTEASRAGEQGEAEPDVFDLEADGAFELEAGPPVFEIAQSPTPLAPPMEIEEADPGPAFDFADGTEELAVLDDESGPADSVAAQPERPRGGAEGEWRALLEEPRPVAEQPHALAREPQPVAYEAAAIEEEPREIEQPPVGAVTQEQARAVAESSQLEPEPFVAAQGPSAEPVMAPEAQPEPEPVSVVVPHTRPTFKLHQPPPSPPADAASKEPSLVELLRTAADQRASTVYAVVDTRPMMRVEGQIALVGTYPSVAAGDVERFIFEFAPRDQVEDPAPEWTCVVPGVGRIRCVAFHDYSGAGLIFRLPAGETSRADELGIPAGLQALCEEADGLIVVAGPRSCGKSTLLSAFVDLINRTRYDHVITIESQIRNVHEKRLSFISQREVRGDGDAIAAAARAALREGPDVLVIEDLRASEALIAALDAARAGRLVFGSISARTAPAAVERLIDAFPADRRPQVRASLAGSLRAVVAQLLVRKASGGRVAAREVLFSSPAVRKLILNGAIEQLPIAIESGRGLGMRTMVDSLGALVHDAVVDIGDACACAPDRAAFISALERDGVDVTGVERRA